MSLLLVLNCYVGTFIPFCIYFDLIKVRFVQVNISFMLPKADLHRQINYVCI